MANTHLGNAGQGEDLMSGLSNDQANKIVEQGKSVAGSGSVVTGGLVYGLTQNAIAAVLLSGYLGKDFFADKVGLTEPKTTRKM